MYITYKKEINTTTKIRIQTHNNIDHNKPFGASYKIKKIPTLFLKY